MSSLSDIFQEARDLVDADSSSYPDATLLRRVNTAYERVVGDIMDADGTWQFDDTNYSTTPVGLMDMVEGQSAYSFSTTFLEILSVKVLLANTTNIWRMVHPVDQSELDFPEENYLIAKSLPFKYDKVGNTIRLLPPPTSTAVTLTQGLKVEFKRTAQLFTCTAYSAGVCITGDVASGTAIPGFASPWHMILAYYAALPYAQSYKKDRVPMIMATIQKMTQDLKTHYGRREGDRRDRMNYRLPNAK